MPDETPSGMDPIDYMQAKFQQTDIALASLAGKFYWFVHALGFISHEDSVEATAEFVRNCGLDVEVIDLGAVDSLTPEMFADPEEPSAEPSDD